MDYLNLIQNKQNELSAMFDRMDRDADMFHSRPYQMLGVAGKKIDKAYHITLLDAAQFLDKAVTRTILEDIISMMKRRKASESQPMAVNLKQNALAKPSAIQAVPVFGGGRQVETQ